MATGIANSEIVHGRRKRFIRTAFVGFLHWEYTRRPNVFPIVVPIVVLVVFFQYTFIYHSVAAARRWNHFVPWQSVFVTWVGDVNVGLLFILRTTVMVVSVFTGRHSVGFAQASFPIFRACAHYNVDALHFPIRRLSFGFQHAIFARPRVDL